MDRRSGVDSIHRDTHYRDSEERVKHRKQQVDDQVGASLRSCGGIALALILGFGMWIALIIMANGGVK